jgi:CheY-like chemotaxis protein
VLLNARDALADHGGVIKMRTRNVVVDFKNPRLGLEAGAYVEFSIEDNGSGMDPDTLAHIFEPFYTTKPVGQGTGMGMAMVHGFADQSGAKLDVQSQIGVGTTISFLFPTDNENMAAKEQGHGARILLVEDNAIVRETALDFLRLQGFTVREAEHSEAAWKVMNNGYIPDILFSDIIMPGEQDGFALASEVREKFPDMHILLTSGWTNGLEKNGGAHKFEVVAKPYNLSKLASILTGMAKLPRDSVHEG